MKKCLVSLSAILICFITTGLAAAMKLKTIKSKKGNTLAQKNNSHVRSLKTKLELESVLQEPGVKIFKFISERCGPCKMIAQDFNELAGCYPTVKAYEIDADNEEFSVFKKECKIKGLPTVISFPSKQLLFGSHSKKEYKEFFKKLSS